MLNVKRLKEYAYGMLSVALRSNDLISYIAAIPPYTINTKNEFDENVDCTFVKMEAIYKYYIEHPDSQLDKKFEETLDLWTLKVKGPEAFLNILNFVEYQIVAEKENRAPFSIDYEKLLNNLKINLIQNNDLYRSEKYVDPEFLSKIQQRDEMLYKNHGRKIL